MVKELTFQQFCDKISKDSNINIESAPASSSNLSDDYKAIADNIIKSLKVKVSKFNTLKLPYITAVFDKFETEEELADELHMKTVDDEIPDSLINYLSSGLYNMEYIAISKQQQNIIKVLAIYIILQI